MAIKTIFLDRDGVINKEINYLSKIEDFEFIDGVFEALLYFQRLKYEMIIVSNQSGIARGYFTEDDYQEITLWMLSKFKAKNIHILDVFHCPHGPKSKCNCRKPSPGMLIKAKEIYDINMENSWMIGDKETDVLAANNAGIVNTILVRSGHKIDEKNSSAKFFIESLKLSKNLINL